MKTIVYFLVFFATCWASVDFSILDASANQQISNQTQLKVLGRGIEDRKTGDTLQLACVGSLQPEPVPNCQLIQGLLQNAVGKLYLVGNPYKVELQNPENPNSMPSEADLNAFKYGLKTDLKQQNLALEEHSIRSRMKHFYYWFGSLAGEENAPITLLFFSVWPAGMTVWMTGSTVAASAVLGIAPLALISLPLLYGLTQIASTPGKIIKGDVFFDFGDFEARDRDYWQFRQRKLTHKGFSKIFRLFSLNDDGLTRTSRTSVISSIEIPDGGRMGTFDLWDGISATEAIAFKKETRILDRGSNDSRLIQLKKYRELNPRLDAKYPNSAELRDPYTRPTWTSGNYRQAHSGFLRSFVTNYVRENAYYLSNKQIGNRIILEDYDRQDRKGEHKEWCLQARLVSASGQNLKTVHSCKNWDLTKVTVVLKKLLEDHQR